jgi:hypothetical protein
MQHGFKFHSAEPTSVMMTHWLPDNETCLLPDGATHTVRFSIPPPKLSSSSHMSLYSRV